ncbi:MAG: polysaccharide deacetylase family protein [Bacteroidetes bacterium]|nr:polysaccharide deacetylase family protein [Bacteroidota bacterium]
MFHSRLLRKVYPGALWQVETLERTVYLTFDDGPHPEITPWVLETLKNYDAKATFFCIGNNIDKYPETYQQILQAGHVTGNHTNHHVNGWKVTTEEYLKDVEACAHYFETPLFRPPYGRMKRSQFETLKTRYKNVVMWSLLSRDYYAGLDIRQSMRFLKLNTVPGSIIVFHDSSKAEKNLKEMLPEYLRFLKEQRYEMKSLPA